MSNFNCEHCGAACIDSPRGYVTGCEHYPADVKGKDMKALTICEPFATLICLPDDHDDAKRVENRTWHCSYTGPLLIHAGKSKAYLSSADDYDLEEYPLTFGAILGIANVAGCFYCEFSSPRLQHVPDWALRRWPWLAGHQHVEGPHCIVLTECRRFKEPIPYKGAQGLFNVPDDVVAEQLQAIGWRRR